MYTNAHSSAISNSHKLQTFHVLINSRMDKVRYIHTVNTVMRCNQLQLYTKTWMNLTLVSEGENRPIEYTEFFMYI